VKLGSIALLLVATAGVGLTLLNASWLAPKPNGPLVLIAHRGIVQPTDQAEGGGCPAGQVRELASNHIENTLNAMHSAISYGARGFAVDVQASADGHAVIFRDETLECRTDGTGRVAERPLSYLRRLDVGHGYSADGGATFPLRGRGVGGMLTAAELVRAYPRSPLIFALADPRAADALVAAFREAGVAIGDQHGFAGPPAARARLRALTQAGWLVDPEVSEACLDGYRRTGWLGLVPEICRGATLILPREGGWTLWGWPYRFLDRMKGAGARTLIGGDGNGERLAGLDQAEQLGEVPHDYRGLLLVEDMYFVGRALQ
jgi:glycerophosphoryl diester phosphodiesterase